MKIGPLTINFKWDGANAERRTPNAERRMSEAEVAAAIAKSEKNPMWRAFMQLLDDFEVAARLNIGGDTSNSTTITWNAGGSEKLAQFKDHLEKERRKALAGFKANPGRLKAFAVTGMRDGNGRLPEEQE